MTETLLIKHSSCCSFSTKTKCFGRIFPLHILKYWVKHICFIRPLWKCDRNTFNQAQFLLFFSTKTKSFDRIYTCAYKNIDWNTFVSVEHYEKFDRNTFDQAQFLLFGFLPKQSVSIEFLHVHIKILTENTFAMVELYENLTETLLIKHSSCCFFLPKQRVLVEFILAHIKILTETHLFQ